MTTFSSLATSLTIFIAMASASSSLLVSAAPDFQDDPCTWKWNGVHKGDFMCDDHEVSEWFNQDGNWAKVLPTFFVMLIGVLVFILTPMIMIFRYCCNCCGSSQLRPNEGCCACGNNENDHLAEEDVLAKYSKSEIWWTKLFAIATLALGICGCSLAVHGALKTSDGVDIYRDGAPKFAGWVDSTLTKAKSGINTTNPIFADSLKKLDDIQSRMQSWIGDVKDHQETLDTIKNSMLGLAFPSFVIVLVSVGAVLCAIFGVRSFAPFILLIITAFGALIVGSLGTGAGALSFAQEVYCGEVKAWRQNQTGLFSWYIVPNVCEQRINFPGFKNELQDDIKDLAVETCKQIAKTCDSIRVYNPQQSSKFYYCPTTPSCTNPTEINKTLETVTVKTGYPNNAGCNSGCNIVQCADRCTNADLKKVSSLIVSNSTQASNAYNVVQNVLLPVLSCDVVTRHFVDAFDVCGSVRTGTEHLYAGCSIAVVTCLILMIVLFLGQKRFIKRSGDRASEYEYNEQLIGATNTQNHQQYGRLNEGDFVKQQPVQF